MFHYDHIKNNVPFRSWLSKIKNTFNENAEDLDIVMPMYILLEYIANCSMTSGSLWNYYKNELEGDLNDKIIVIIMIITI